MNNDNNNNNNNNNNIINSIWHAIYNVKMIIANN